MLLHDWILKLDKFKQEGLYSLLWLKLTPKPKLITD